MQRQEPSAFFDQQRASEYDKRFEKLAPMRDALHLILGAVFAGLPVDARLLCVGAGTGLELAFLAEKFPGWSFTAVEPSGPMLEVCRRRAETSGFASRCQFHEGYLNALPAAEPFDAATSLLVSHFILSPEARTTFFREIAERLRPGGILANADLTSDVTSPEYESLLEVWMELMRTTGISEEQIENMRATYRRDVAIAPHDQVCDHIASAGFETPVQFLQTVLIHAWYARRRSD